MTAGQKAIATALIYPEPEKLRRKSGGSKLEPQIKARLSEARAIVGWSRAQAEAKGLVQKGAGRPSKKRKVRFLSKTPAATSPSCSACILPAQPSAAPVARRRGRPSSDETRRSRSLVKLVERRPRAKMNRA